MTTATQTNNNETDNTQEEVLSFGTDVSRLLDIVANSLYSHHDVFLRELISNSSDACDKLRYEAISSPSLTEGNGDFHIRVNFNTENSTFSVSDNGIGMSRQDLIDNLGTIAKSGTASLMESMKSASGGENNSAINLIGQFGVGFYSCFMVADEATVISKKAGSEEIWTWISDGRTGYKIRHSNTEEKQQLAGTSGTVVLLKLKDQGRDFLLEEKVKHVINHYSDHIDFPIYFGDKADKETPVNSATAIWTRPKNEITEEQYKEFYHHITFAMDEPLLTLHWKAEGTICFSALLYVPTMRPWNMYDPSRKAASRLYVKRVFITDDCETLIYPWLRFIKGVIDSEDLPLNISRESLQHNYVLAKIRKSVTGKVLSELDKLSRNDKESFETFWHQFGAVIKEGLYDAYEHREEIFKITRFFSTKGSGQELVSLDEYIERMPEEQDCIYYISGENPQSMANSPQTEGFRSRGIEVLVMNDVIDDFWLQAVHDYKGKKFVSVTKGNVDLSKFSLNETENTDSEENKQDNNQEIESALEQLPAKIAQFLKNEIGEVRYSSRLTESPVCLIAGDNEADLKMERVLKIQQKFDSGSKRVLEINRKHPIIINMAKSLTDNSNNNIEDIAFLLLDQAKIIQGEPVTDISLFSKRMSKIMQKFVEG